MLDIRAIRSHNAFYRFPVHNIAYGEIEIIKLTMWLAMKNKLLVMPMVVLALFCSFNAVAKDKGFYVGGSVGSADVSVDSLSFDENDFAWKIFAGYQLIGLFAVEGGYVDFGAPSSGNFKVDPTGWNAFGIVGLPVGPIRLFGKLGGIYWDSDVSGGPSDDGTGVAAGLGLEFELFSLGVRAEVEYFDALDDIYMLSVGATYTF